MKYIYILQCINNKYFIGLTEDFEKDYSEHLKETKSDQTKIHKVIGIDGIFDNIKNHYIIIISKYIYKYGNENILFDDVDINKVNDMITKYNTNILYYRKCLCSNKHWIIDCYFNIKKNVLSIIYTQNIEKIIELYHTYDICIKCGKIGHKHNECYSINHIDGSKIIYLID